MCIYIKYLLQIYKWTPPFILGNGEDNPLCKQNKFYNNNNNNSKRNKIFY